MTDDTETGTEPDSDSEAYDPMDPTPPVRAPPHRRTAPQSDFTIRQVGIGILVLFLVLGTIVGLGIGLA